MHTLQGLPLLGYYQKLVATQENEYAWKILHEFFDAFDKEGAQELLWFMLTAAMKLDNEDINGRHRSNMIFFYEYAVAFFKAVHVLHEQRLEQLISSNDRDE